MSNEKQEDLSERLERARRERHLEPREGHEVTAAGKEARTPTDDEFFGNLEKALEPPADELPHPRKDQNGAS